MDLRGLQSNGEIWLQARLKENKERKNSEVFLFMQPPVEGGKFYGFLESCNLNDKLWRQEMW